MSGIVSYTSFDYKSVTIVPVIASFNSEGKIAPLWVRINGNAYKIDSYWSNVCFRNIVEFRCKIIDGDCLKPLSLTFYREEGMWTIPKI